MQKTKGSKTQAVSSANRSGEGWEAVILILLILAILSFYGGCQFFESSPLPLLEKGLISIVIAAVIFVVLVIVSLLVGTLLGYGLFP